MPTSPASRLTVQAGAGTGLILLTLAAFLSYFDRVMITVVAAPIKAEFGLSDTQLGLLSGPVFAVVYALTGLFLARWRTGTAGRC
jgi:predicted MFS family arabinose efflux permease